MLVKHLTLVGPQHYLGEPLQNKSLELLPKKLQIFKMVTVVLERSGDQAWQAQGLKFKP